MSVTKTIRDVNELAPNAKLAVQLMFQECAKQNVHIFITETYRSQARQNYLYTFGRSGENKNKSKVTWTLKSNHSSRLAWDIGAVTGVNGVTNIYDMNIIRKAANIARKLGITCGIDWKTVDPPHFEINKNWKMPKGYVLDGIVTIPTKSSEKIKFVKKNKNQQAKIENQKVVNYLNDTGRKEIRELLKKARDKGIINTSHTDAKIAKYNDIELLSYQAAVINRTFK